MKQEKLSAKGQELMDRLASGKALSQEDVIALLQELGEG
jgi:hypothetical protein